MENRFEAFVICRSHEANILVSSCTMLYLSLCSWPHFLLFEQLIYLDMSYLSSSASNIFNLYPLSCNLASFHVCNLLSFESFGPAFRCFYDALGLQAASTDSQ